ncbi:MAG: UDP-N-acetylglucosamine 1-carboxyvinyltransferase [Patescibacteria group bacterium]|jgi:UDP-N-acetylglucosamine 1-carboxyvinyltransferase
MEYFSITGGTSLNGDIAVSGAKNAALKLLSAALLTKETCVLHNVPDIADVRSMIKLLQLLGAKVEYTQHTVTVTAEDITDVLDYQLVKHMRASIVLIGPLVARIGRAVLPLPGGCLIGARPIDTHVNAFTQMGIKVEYNGDLYTFTRDAFRGSRVILDEMSVTATENILIAACLAPGHTEIRLAACEPEIADLARFLISMGAKIDGIDTSTLRIQGVKSLHGTEHTLIPDRIEAGTFAIAAAVSRGTVNIHGVIPDHLDAVLNTLSQANVRYEFTQESGEFQTMHILPTTIFEPVSIATRPHPGFPTDLQAPLSVLMTQANGTSKIFETMYDGRLGYIQELHRMGANAEILDSHTALVSGPTALYGKRITSLDIRAGATLLIAAIIANGESQLEHIERIDRGYERIEDRLNALGAKIKRLPADIHGK